MWLLWSGVYDKALVLALGAASCVSVLLLYRRMLVAHPDGEPSRPFSQLVGVVVRTLLYVPWLLWEIVKANIDVTKIILAPSLPISPRIIRVDVLQKTDFGQVLYANSITLTPGTITLDVRDGAFLVHALTKDTADGVYSGDMDRRCAKVEGEL
jgi:multicomponent Na+:H+ antiporter subunit E